VQHNLQSVFCFLLIRVQAQQKTSYCEVGIAVSGYKLRTANLNPEFTGSYKKS